MTQAKEVDQLVVRVYAPNWPTAATTPALADGNLGFVVPDSKSGQ